MRTYFTVTEIKQANQDAGQHFFDRDTMRFFRSRILRDVIGGRFFITSEQFVYSDGVPEPRRYSVRMVDDRGHIETVGDFQGYETAAQARAVARKMSAEQ